MGLLDRFWDQLLGKTGPGAWQSGRGALPNGGAAKRSTQVRTGRHGDSLPSLSTAPPPTADPTASQGYGGGGGSASGDDSWGDLPQRPMTPEREKLIREAMEVHRAKRKIVENMLTPEQQQLVADLLKKMLAEGRKK